MMERAGHLNVVLALKLTHFLAEGAIQAGCWPALRRCAVAVLLLYLPPVRPVPTHALDLSDQNPHKQCISACTCT